MNPFSRHHLAMGTAWQFYYDPVHMGTYPSGWNEPLSFLSESTSLLPGQKDVHRRGALGFPCLPFQLCAYPFPGSNTTTIKHQR